MIHLKRFLIDLIRVKEWRIYLYISHLLWKIKDYDRIEHDYSHILHYTTNNRMYKTNHRLIDVCSKIEYRVKSKVDSYKLEIIDLIDKGATIEEIKKYLML